MNPNNFIFTISNRVNSLLENKWIIKIINYAAIAVYIDFNISSFLSIHKEGDNLALWKITATGQHHLVDFFGIILCFFVLLPIFYKNPKTRKGYAIIAFFTNYFIVALHEMFWFASAAISTLIFHAYNSIFNLEWIYRGEFFFPYLATIATFLILSNRGAWFFPKRTIIFVLIYYVFWIAIGFEVSIWYTGYTVWFYNVDVNILEIVSWLIPIFTFPVEQYKYLTIWLNKSKPLGQQNLTLSNIRIGKNDKYINTPKQ